MTVQSGSPPTAMTLSNPWAVVPSLGHLDAYITAVNRLPLLSGVRELAAQGMVTGASGRNWSGYGQDVQLPASFAPQDQALLSDPQTSGGLLVACHPDTVDQVLATFRDQGFDRAAVVGRVSKGAAQLTVND